MDKPENKTVPLDRDEFLVRQAHAEVRFRLPEPGIVDFGREEPEEYTILDGDPGSGDFSFLFRNVVYRVSSDADDQASGSVSFKINRSLWKGSVDNSRSLLARRFGAKTGASSGEVTIKAPMPGLVSKILVKNGDSVKKGDGLLILEAMKMENELKAEHNGSIVRVDCAEGNPVDKNAKLIVIQYDQA